MELKGTSTILEMVKDGNGIEFYNGVNQKRWSGAEYLNGVRSVLMRGGGSDLSVYSTKQ